MVAHSHPVQRRPGTGTSFIGSFLDDPDQALIVLRGDIDTAVVDRLGLHIEDFLATGARFLLIEAADVDTYDPGLVELLGRTQHRLGRYRGLLQVRGLRISLPSVAVTPRSVPEPRPASQARARRTVVRSH